MAGNMITMELDQSSLEEFKKRVIAAVANIMTEEYEKIVLDRYGPDNNRFTPLSAATIRIRASKGYPPAPIMVRSKTLLNDIREGIELVPSGSGYFLLKFNVPHYALQHSEIGGGMLRQKKDGGFVHKEGRKTADTKLVPREPVAFFDQDIEKLLSNTAARLSELQI